MQLQTNILLFFESLHNPVLDTIVSGITKLGADIPILAVIIFIYWCVNKRKGFAICFNMLGALSVMNIMKSIVRFPRPWKVIEGIDSLNENATGYSFPSGHATIAASTYSAVAVSVRKRWLSAICGVLIVLICLSRLYLCVHWPLDVFCGLLIGCASTFFMLEMYQKLYDMKEKAFRAMLIISVIAICLDVLIVILLELEKIDYDAFIDVSKNLSLLSGCFLGYVMERGRTDFRIEEGQWGRKIIRFIIGVLVAMVLFSGLKSLFIKLDILTPATSTCRYFLSGFWACGLYPLIGCRLRLFSPSESR